MVLVWEPIKDLPADWSNLTDGELGPLLRFWNEQRADLEQTGALAEFNIRLAREWSIETGQIEGVYDLDRGVTQTLIERGIDADLIPHMPGQKLPEMIAAIVQDHADVLEGLFQFVKGERPVSKSYIHELHAALLKHQDTTVKLDQFGNLFEARLSKGKYKQQSNNPRKLDGAIHQYCPPAQVDPEMDRLLAMHNEHAKQNVPVEIEAAWLHHRFTQIHPYEDGNGRVARAWTSLLFIKSGWFPAVISRLDRGKYIDALETADEGDLRSLISLFVSIQRRALIEAIRVAADIETTLSIEGEIAAAKRILSIGKDREPAAWMVTRNTADRLMDIAAQRLEEIKADLDRELGASMKSSVTKPVPNEANQRCTLDFGADHFGKRTIAVEQHIVGSKFRGLIEFEVTWKDFSFQKVVSKERFQVNHAEAFESAKRRFLPWLEESLVSALTQWRKSL